MKYLCSSSKIHINLIFFLTVVCRDQDRCVNIIRPTWLFLSIRIETSSIYHLYPNQLTHSSFDCRSTRFFVLRWVHSTTRKQRFIFFEILHIRSWYRKISWRQISKSITEHGDQVLDKMFVSVIFIDFMMKSLEVVPHYQWTIFSDIFHLIRHRQDYFLIYLSHQFIIWFDVTIT